MHRPIRCRGATVGIVAGGICNFIELPHGLKVSKYVSKKYRTTLETAGLRVSMTRKGHCRDNAHMESFLGGFKTEMVYFLKFPQLDETVAYITDYIRFYNCERLHSNLGYCTPIQFEANAA